MKTETGDTFLGGKPVDYTVTFDPFNTRNRYTCNLLKYRGCGDNPNDAIMDAHKKYYAEHQEELHRKIG